jgi:2-keto-4-pentenoate hydratase/2-oxohepta-3-ene-1,7-dioic acid hydratase in catechol pathway
MRLVTFTYQGQTGLGSLVLQDEYVLDFSRACPELPPDMIEFLRAGEKALALAQTVTTTADKRYFLPVTGVTLLAPVPRPGKIIGLGHNYYDHMGIGKTAPAEYPTIFGKTNNTVIGPGQPILIPPVTQQVDYEAELAVVMGRQTRGVAPEQALEFVAGYTIFNDVSARDYQKRTSQWMLGKSFDTFGPMGPALVTKDEIPDPHNLRLSLTLNGLEMQQTHTGQMIFSIPYLIAYLSAVMTLEPGDIISTGTPAKTSAAQSVPPFMKPGDEVRIVIEKIGELANPVRAV